MTCLKAIVKNSARIIIALGLVIFAFGLYVLWQTVTGDYKNLYINDSDWLKTFQQYGVIIIGLVIFLFGLAGVYGAAKERKKCLLFFFLIGSIIFAIMFFALAGFIKVYTKAVFDKDTTNEPEIFNQIQTGVNAAALLFCHEPCQCYTGEAFNDTQLENFKLTNVTKTDKKLPNDVTQCELYDSTNPTLVAASQFLSAAESLFSCSGWREPIPYYIFSDISRGTTDGKGCFEAAGDFFTSKGNLFLYVFIGFGLLFGFNVLAIILLLCGKDKKKKVGQYYRV
ncbi:hypothetical protein pb186bvf_003986 [Paramecium bursaria]